jgi:hypothetical protein
MPLHTGFPAERECGHESRERPAENRKASASFGDTGFPVMAALRGAGEGGSFGVPCSRQSAQLPL